MRLYQAGDQSQMGFCRSSFYGQFSLNVFINDLDEGLEGICRKFVDYTKL